MSDWNPAEILGADPKPLDISFYRSLITQETWVEGRASLGWRRPSSAHDLLKTVFGKPYVRVATSLESLLPAALPSDTMRELLHDRLQYLKLNPGLHDKIEFLVAPSAPTTDHLSFIERFQLNQVKQSSALLYFDSLRQLVRNCLSEGHSWRSNDLAGIEKLRAASRRLHDVDVTHLTHRDFGRLIDGAMKVCKEKGTLPFARQARLAFMCRQILDYLLEASPDARGIVAKWMLQISSPYSQMELFLERMRHDQGSTEDFLLEFGHLRPLMYSITSTRLDSDLTLYNSIIHKEDIFHPTGICTPSTPKIDVAADYLTSIGLNWDSERILEECANAFSAREKLKFEFSRITSAILKVIANWAEAYGIELDNIRNTSLPELLKAMDTCESSKALRHMIGNIAEQHLSAPKVSDRYLPEIAFQLTDFMCVQEQASSPTFIGERAARGRVYFMDRANVNHGASLMGKIVVAEAADPGLDWIFTQGIAGLVTKFGGRFSHMALRAAQVGIAAAIGCGDELYRSAIVSDEIELRPMEEKLVFFDRPPR